MSIHIPTAPNTVTHIGTGGMPTRLPVPRPGHAMAVVAVVLGIVLAGIAGLVVAVYIVGGLGLGAAAGGGIMALVPLSIVLAGVHWVDRWEPEPRLALVFAFLWGSAGAVLIALLVGAQVDNVVASLGGSDSTSEFFLAVIQAPIVEESSKGFGLLLIFWIGRRFFDGPVDGVVYAAMLAGGFAFSENILYFGSQLVQEGGLDGSVLQIFLIRGLMSPFAHVMFTSCTGIALGIAASRTGAFGAIGFFLLGLIPAIALHALWNGSLYLVSNFFGYYLLVQVPLFLAAVALVMALRRAETRVTAARLHEYAVAGWFAADEVVPLATPNGRRAASQWAAQNGRAPQMRRYIQDATRLAFARQRLVTGRADTTRSVADEAILLDAVLDSRRRLVAG